jgi:hypothetical protein
MDTSSARGRRQPRRQLQELQLEQGQTLEADSTRLELELDDEEHDEKVEHAFDLVVSYTNAHR